MLLTIELEYHLFLELDESITLTCCLCVWQNDLLSFSGKLLVELLSFSMIHFKQLGSGLSPQSWLYFQTVHASK